MTMTNLSPRYDLDLTKTWFSRRYGDITVFGTWFGKEQRPALALVPTNSFGNDNYAPCVVPLANAHLWAEEGGDGRHCARASIAFAYSLGFNDFDITALHRIGSAIRDCLSDLISMPPKPVLDRVVVADAIRTDENGREHHAEISENV